MLIEAREIDDHILEKIESRHGVQFEEVREACFRDRLHVRHDREGFYKIFSRTKAGRYLLVVLVRVGGGLLARCYRSGNDQHRASPVSTGGW